MLYTAQTKKYTYIFPVGLFEVPAVDANIKKPQKPHSSGIKLWAIHKIDKHRKLHSSDKIDELFIMAANIEK